MHSQKRPHPATILLEREAAQYLRCSVSYLRAGRLKEPRANGPPYVRLGRAVRYRLGDLDAWLDARKTT